MRRGLFALLLAAAAAPPCTAAPPENVLATEEHLRKVIKAAKPSVVAVIVSHSDRYPSLPPAEQKIPGRLGSYTRTEPFPMRRWPPRVTTPNPLDLSDPQTARNYLYGSGVVLDTTGQILTAYHLIQGATKVYVRTANGRGYYADIHAADARSDLAVLKPAEELPRGLLLSPIEFATVRTSGEKPTVAEGMFVVALGHPAAAGLADGSASASWGIVSNIGRRAANQDREDQRSRALYHYSILLQTDARVTLGSSGGPLLNMDGQMIGLATPMAAVTGAETAGGFAIPFDRNYRRIVDALRMGREVEYGFLGVQSSSEWGLDGSEAGGVRIQSVVPGTPAAAANLMSGDFVVSIDGEPIRDPDDLFLHVGAALAGTRLKVVLLRNGQRVTADVTLAKLDHPLPWIASERPSPVHGLRVDYSSILLVQKQNAPRGVVAPRIPPGVMVRELEPGSAAEARFKDLGTVPTQWLITQVNGQPVATPPEFYREVAKSPAGPVLLKLVNSDDPDTQRELKLP